MIDSFGARHQQACNVRDAEKGRLPYSGFNKAVSDEKRL